LGKVLAPDVVHELINGNRAIGFNQQYRQYSALPVVAEANWLTVVECFDRAKHAELRCH
jgi:hypothetical protein